MAKERNYGVDLLRLVLMFMVCMLHTLGLGGILKSCEVGSLNYKIYWFIEIFSYCAVDGFAFISGYMAIDKPRKYEKLVEMWFQAFFYSFIVTFILTVVGVNETWEKKDILKCALPITYAKFWYFTAFFILFLAVPILNKFIFGIDEATAKKTLIVIFILFSIVGSITDPFRVQSGFSAMWLIVLYVMGALAKRVKLFEKRKSITLIIIWACCILITWGVQVFAKSGRLTNYMSPTILLSGIIMVVLFSRIKIKGTIISKLSPLAFGIYLFQLNQVVGYGVIEGAFSFVASKNIIVGVGYAFAFASLIFVSGMLVDFIRSQLAKLIKIPTLSKKIVRVIDKCLTKLFVVIK